MSSTLSPRSPRSSLVSFGSPPGFACGLPVAARDSARERAAIDAAFCSLAGSSWARTSSSTDPSWARFLSRSPGLSRSRSASARSSSARSRAGITRLRALALEVLGDLVDALGLALRLLADLPVLRDHEVHRVRQEDRGQHQRGRDERDQGRPPRDPRAEQARIHGSQAGHRVAPLAAHEARLRLGDVERAVHRDRVVVGAHRGPGGRRHRAREGQCRCHGIPCAALGIDGQGCLAERRSRPHHEDEEHQEAQRPGWRGRRAAPARGGAAAGRSRAGARPRPRPQRRTTRAGRSAAARAGDDARRDPPGSPVSAGSSTTPERGRVGRDVAGRRRHGPRTCLRPGRADPRHHPSPPAGRRRGRGTRMRQRRVGDTSWTDRTMRISAPMTIAATLRGQ